MPRRKDGFSQHHYYHIYNRGFNRNTIFFTQNQYKLCLRKVSKYAARYKVSVIAYCLMPNHYHFILRQDGENELSKFMGIVFNAYVQAVNLEIGRSGSLFEGPFKHKHIDDLAYLIGACSYIHLNPVKAGLVKRPQDWQYSNYREWIGIRDGKLIDQELVHEYFPVPGDYKNYVNDWLDERLPERYRMD